MFPADRLPVPVFVYYTARGKRVRKWFENGLDLRVRRFYAAKEKQGRNPKLVRADGEPSLSPTEDSQ